MSTRPKAIVDERMADHEYRACLRKRKYATEDLALTVGEHSTAMTKKKMKRTVVIRAYQCSFCRCWHLTHDRRHG